MSAATRHDLAAAASTVPGVACTAYYVQTADPGAGFVRLASTTRDDTGFGWMDTWQVLVVLPQEIAEAERRLDDLVPALCEALADEGAVTAAQPVQLGLEATTVPALAVTVIRAQE